MINEYNKYTEIAFIKSFINEYKLYANDDDKSEIIFQKNYNKLLESIDVNKLFHYYSLKLDEDISSTIKLGIIIHMKVIRYILDYYNDDYYNDYHFNEN